MIVRLTKESSNLQEAVAETRKQVVSNKKIVIEPGEYFIEDAIKLTNEDSGLSIIGEGNVKLFGGRKITKWQKKDNKLLYASLPEVKSGNWDFRMLIVNGRFASRARYPESGYLLHNSEFDVSWQSTYEGGFVRKPTHEELTTLDYNPEDIPERFCS